MTAGASERLKRHVPWRARIVGKIALSRLPAGYGMWRALSLFRHGAMDRPDYAYSVFSGHHRAAGMSGRLRYGELLDIFRAAGFAVQVTDRRGWNAPPIRRDKLAVPFRGLSDDDLSVSEFGVVPRPLPGH